MSDTNALSTLPSTLANSQATLVESQRAIAEVQGAILVAQNVPRDTLQARAQMLDSCKQEYLAEKAFFRFPRGGQQVSGPSIHLARELARCWGNIQYGIKEMSRDDVRGISEMQAWAWDVQTNTRTETMFLVPHKRDKTRKRGDDGPPTEDLTSMRDIYENNANAGARRVRECIFAVLPPWFVEQAKQTCLTTNEGDGEKPLVDRVSDAIDRFATVKVTREQLERKVGAPAGKWTAQDIAVLVPIYRSISSGETTRELEFPIEVITRDLLPDAPPKHDSLGVPITPDVQEALAADPGPDPRATVRKILAVQMQTVGHPDLDAALDDIRVLTGRPDLQQAEDLSVAELSALVELMESVVSDEKPELAMEALLDATREGLT